MQSTLAPPQVPPEAIRDFVEVLESIRQPDMGFREDAALPPLPECASGAGLSRYLLLAAAIDVGVNSNDIRPFLAALDARVLQDGRKEGLFDVRFQDAQLVEEVIAAEQRAGSLLGWQAKRQVPRILAEANCFVVVQARRDLDAWASRQVSPSAVVKSLATGIFFQGKGGTEARKKMWMLMRWLIRPHPDLRRWNWFSPADLFVPVDRHVAGFALSAGILKHLPKGGPFWQQVEEITAFARDLFPDDPACVDYAFFMWGRGRTRPLGDPDTCHTLLRDHRLECPLASLMPCSNNCKA